jgi:hypothetical protein
MIARRSINFIILNGCQDGATIGMLFYLRSLAVVGTRQSSNPPQVDLKRYHFSIHRVLAKHHDDFHWSRNYSLSRHQQCCSRRGKQ